MTAQAEELYNKNQAFLKMKAYDEELPDINAKDQTEAAKLIADQAASLLIQEAREENDVKRLVYILGRVPVIDGELVRFVSNEVFYRYIYVPMTKENGTWYKWDATIWGELNNPIIHTTALADASAYFLKKLAVGWTRVLEDKGITKTNIPKPKKDEPAVELTPEQETANSLWEVVERLPKQANLFLSLKSKGPMCLEFTRKLHKSPGTFFDDSAYIVDAKGAIIFTNNPTMTPIPPKYSRPVTRKLGVAFDKVDPNPGLWQNTLDLWLPDRDDQRYLQVGAGAALLGRGDAKNIVALWGLSDTAKSTYAKTMVELFGNCNEGYPGYGRITGPEALLNKTGTNWEQADLKGMRFIVGEDIKDAHLDDSFLKNFAGGGGTITTQEKFKSPESWKVQGVLHLTANHQLAIDMNDTGMYTRLDLLQFHTSFPKGDPRRVESFEKVLVEQAGRAILDWVIAGAVEYLETKTFPRSKNIITEREGLRYDKSNAVRWVTTYVEDNNDFEYDKCYKLVQVDLESAHSGMIARKMAYNLYVKWAEHEGIKDKAILDQEDWQKQVNIFRGVRDLARDRKRTGGYNRLQGYAIVRNKGHEKCEDTCTVANYAMPRFN